MWRQFVSLADVDKNLTIDHQDNKSGTGAGRLNMFFYSS